MTISGDHEACPDEPSDKEQVKETVGGLVVDQLIGLAAAGQTEDLEQVARAWAEYQDARILHDKAYDKYVEDSSNISPTLPSV